MFCGSIHRDDIEVRFEFLINGKLFSCVHILLYYVKYENQATVNHIAVIEFQETIRLH